jgi:HNH endonuclease
MYLMYDNESTGGILKDTLSSLPRDLKDRLLRSIVVTASDGDLVRFRSIDGIDIESIRSAVARFERSKIRSENRSNDMWHLSSGLFEPEDIEKLFDAQEGVCYYTGEKLTNKPRNFSVDHIVPVVEGGASWPINLVLALRSFNHFKRHQSKRKVFSILKSQRGEEWYANQKRFCLIVDVRRKAIDRHRRKQVEQHVAGFQRILSQTFAGVELRYELVRDDLVLEVQGTVINFPPGFIRKRKRFNSLYYLVEVIHATVGYGL